MADIKAFAFEDPWSAVIAETRAMVVTMQQTRDSVIRIETLLEPNGAVDQKFKALTAQIEDAKDLLESARSGMKEDLDREIGAMLKSLRDQSRRMEALERNHGVATVKISVLKNRMDRVRWWVAGGLAVLTAIWWVVEQFLKIRGSLR